MLLFFSFSPLPFAHPLAVRFNFILNEFLIDTCSDILLSKILPHMLLYKVLLKFLLTAIKIFEKLSL